MPGHDHHFLSRLDRVSDEHVELALSLYRDPTLVELVLSSCALDEGQDRVAIALGPVSQGPYLIVARSGAFVTCLGEGMSPGDRPVISRGKLDRIARNVPHLHAKLEFAKRAGTAKKGLAVLLRNQIMKAGADLCREDFQAALALHPLLAIHYLCWMHEAGEAAAILRTRLVSVKKPSPSLEEPLHKLFELSLAVGHFCLLAWADPKLILSKLPVDQHAAMIHVAWLPARQGIAASLYRGLWAAGRVGKPILAGLKRHQAEVGSDLTAWAVAGSLAAIGVRHAKLRSEVAKCFVEAPCEGMQDKDYVQALSRLLHAAFEDTLRDGDLSVPEAEKLARHLMHAELRKEGILEYATPDDVPLDVSREAVAQNFMPFLRQEPRLLVVLAALGMWGVTFNVEDFYPPRADRLARRFRWRPGDTLRILASFRDYSPRRPFRAAAAPGANDPCSCGSGKKFKKCCGRPGAAPTDRRSSLADVDGQDSPPKE
jgi:hypothetical protein